MGGPITIDRTDLKITSAGFENTSVKLGRYHCTANGSDLLEAHSYDALVTSVPFEVRVSYTKLELIGFENGLPESFFKKLPYIRRLWVSRPRNPLDVLEFLKKSRCPDLVIIGNPRLGQNFYDSLPCSSSLVYLSMEDRSCKDFDFLSNLTKLEHLKFFSTSKWPVDSINRVIKKCKFFYYVELGVSSVIGKILIRFHFDVYTRVAHVQIGQNLEKLPKGSPEQFIQFLKECEVTKGYCN